MTTVSSARPMPLFLCCDLVARMRQDITCLTQDIQTLAELHKKYESQKVSFQSFYRELENKLKRVPLVKRSADEKNFVHFVKFVWQTVSRTLERSSKGVRFISMTGMPVVTHVNKLKILTEFILANCVSDFYHTDCAAVYQCLSNQLISILFPELGMADELESSHAYLNSAAPAILNLMTVIDFYLSTPKYRGVRDVCNEIVHGLQIYDNRRFPLGKNYVGFRCLASLLRGDLLGIPPPTNLTPVVQDKLADLYKYGREMSQYLLELTDYRNMTSFSRPSVGVKLGPGSLDPRVNEMPEPSPPAPSPPLSVPMFQRARGRPRKRRFEDFRE